MSSRDSERVRFCAILARMLLTCGGLLLSGLAPPAQAADIRLRTPLGDLELDLLEQEAPNTVANFLSYVRDGDFENVFFHRSVPGFIIQSGGYTFTDGTAVPVPADPPVVNEFGRSNTRGTVAMAKVGGDPNSATSGWFINLADNSENLDNQNGGFTVFAVVVGNGMAVADQIAALPVWDAGSPFNEIPLIGYQSGSITAQQIVFVSVAEDFDGDGTYDDEDTDDDNDGLPDDVEIAAGLDPLDPTDAGEDLDGDGYSNLREFQDGTDMTDPASNFTTRIVILKTILGGSSILDEP